MEIMDLLSNNSKFRLYSTVIFLIIFIRGTANITQYFPNTAEHVMQEFLEESLNQTIPGLEYSNETSLLIDSVWGFYQVEPWITAILGNAVALCIDRKLSTIAYMRLVPAFQIVGLSVEFMAKIFNHWALLLVGQFIANIGYGIAFSSLFVFYNEIGGPLQRDRVLMVHKVANMGFITLATLLGHQKLLGTQDLWHYSFIICIILSLVGFFGLSFIHESPEYLTSIGDFEAAERALWFYQGIGKVNTSQSKDIGDMIENHSRKYSNKDLLPVFFIVFLVTVGQQRTGFKEFITYSTIFFKLFSLSLEDAQSFAVISKFVLTIAVFPASILVTALSRRYMFLSSLIWSGASTTFCCFHDMWPLEGTLWGYLFAGTLCINLLAGFVSQAMFSIVVPEMLPYQSRLRGKNLSMFLTHIIGLASIWATPPMTRILGSSVFLFNAVPLWICAFVLWILLPELKGKTSEDVLEGLGIDHLCQQKEEN